MKKLLVHPFTKEICPLIRHRAMLSEYTVEAAVPEKGFGWENKDIGEIDGGIPTGFLLGGEFLDESEKCDEIISEISADITPASILKEIPVPVMMVAGLGENCQKFDIQLGLRNEFMQSGYKVSQFGTKPYSGLFGFEPWPRAPEMPLWKKVYFYNDILWETYKRETPDVMIIGVPGAIMPIASNANEMFGETALALAYAAKPDMAILSYYYAKPTHEYFEMLRQCFRYRFGINNVFFHASNTKLIINEAFQNLSYLTLASQFVLDELSQTEANLPPDLFNALIPESSKPAYQKIIARLQQNFNTI